ncbi:GNAT family N-acetyltransferase [Staphylococcus gallinarum]|uniref:GNAT family N-acetyltransferase n=1 Tax=Staphylococcus gallinarum TaxID=1293 RepID=A0A3A0W8U2_STAGA|nr:GNAT family N-acetyltransferase [Staphylococcus gallinarum]RIP37308.1 GNAT family N-acetyltransferase [Staphylococcus gallinarum]
MEFTIRPLTETDKQGKAIVHYESWIETYNDISVNDYLENLDKEQFIKKSSLHDAPTLVAVVNNEIVGFISYGKVKHPTSTDDWSEIFALYLLEEYQHHMIGFALTQRALELSFPDNVTLWVVEENDNAIQFYEQIGFKQTDARQPVYFGKMYNEIQMNYIRQDHDN